MNERITASVEVKRPSSARDNGGAKAAPATTMIAELGLMLSFLMSVYASRVQLSGLWAGDLLMRLAPVCAGGSVVAGWSIGATLAGAPLRLTTGMRWIGGLFVVAEGGLVVGAIIRTVAQLAAGHPLEPSFGDGALAPLVLAVWCGFVLAGGSLSKESGPVEAPEVISDVLDTDSSDRR